MGGNISFSERHQGASVAEEKVAEEVLKVDLKPIDDIKSNIEQSIRDMEEYVEHKPSNEAYSILVNLEGCLKTLNN